MKKVIPILLVFNLLLSLCFFELTASATSFSGSDITVKLSAYLGNESTVKVSITGKYLVEIDNRVLDGTYDIKVESGQLALYKNGIRIKSYGATLTVRPEIYNTDHIISVGGHEYLGMMRFEVESGSYVRPYNTLPVEDYLKGVVSQEMSPYWGNTGGMEALKAQAIAARTYAQGVSPIDDGQTDQVYTGYNWHDNTNIAVEQTQGLVLRYNGQIIGANALYSSSNGGKILSKVNSWGDAAWNRIPYLQAKEDPYDAKSSGIGNKNVNWSFSITKQQIDITSLKLAQPATWWNNTKEIQADQAIIANIKNWLKNNGYVKNNYEIKIVSIPQVAFNANVPSNQTINGQIKINYWLRDTSSNKFMMENEQIKTYSTLVDTRAYTIRSMIGSAFMKSPYVKNVQDNGEKFTVNGGGWGHGIGMSQWGAYQMSKEGKTFSDILSFYYPGTTVDDVLGPTITDFTAAINDAKVVTFKYMLDEESTTNISLDNPQKEILINSAQNAGNVQFTWDASSLSAGDYTFTIIAKDKSGNVSQGKGSFTISESEPSEGSKSIKLVLTAPKTFLYNGPNGVGYTGQYISPQTIYANANEGNWYRINTWIGPKWIEVVETVPPVEITKITLLDRTNLYSTTSTNQKADSSISPQSVTVVEQKGDWFKIKTWIGEKWIKPESYSIAVDKKIAITQRESIYGNPKASEKAVSSLSVQTVTAIGEIPGTGWYQIKTWLGPMWIQPKQAINQSIILNSKTNIYDNPDLDEKPFSSLSPQTVRAINKIGNTGWYQINTWVGPKWIFTN